VTTSDNWLMSGEETNREAVYHSAFIIQHSAFSFQHSSIRNPESGPKRGKTDDKKVSSATNLNSTALLMLFGLPRLVYSGTRTRITNPEPSRRLVNRHKAQDAALSLVLVGPPWPLGPLPHHSTQSIVLPALVRFWTNQHHSTMILLMHN
jgi:hypothetical protein